MAAGSYFKSYGIPAQGTRTISMTTFRGVDMTTDPAEVDLTRSPDAPNMICNADGLPVKRPAALLKYGDEFIAEISEHGTTFHGVWEVPYTDTDQVVIPAWVYHIGTALYVRSKRDSEPHLLLDYTKSGWPAFVIDDTDSSAVVLPHKHNVTSELCTGLWILTGEDYYYLRQEQYQETNAEGISVWRSGPNWEFGRVTAIATVPTINLGKGPLVEDGGMAHELVNLMIDRQWEEFTFPQKVYKADGSLDPNYEWQNRQAEAQDIYVSIKPMIGVANGDVTVKQMYVDSDGLIKWKTLTMGDTAHGQGDYSVSQDTGLIHFRVSPGPSPITGESNIRVYYRSVRGPQSRKVRKCRFCAAYGVGGEPDRIFMSGNPEEANMDRWSEMNDPTYIADRSYSVLGAPEVPIVGYTHMGNSLVTFKNGEADGRNAYVRYGSLNESAGSNDDATFRITNIVQGEGAVSSGGFASLLTEPVFLTRRGLYAITAADVTGEKYGQLRSYYINKPLTREDLTTAQCCVWGQFLCIATGSGLYLLDTDKRTYEPHAWTNGYQYDAWYWPGVRAKKLWVENERLCFAPMDGVGIRHFEEAWMVLGAHEHSMMENTTAWSFEAYWKTPLLRLGSITRRATVTDTAVEFKPMYRFGADIRHSSNNEEESFAYSCGINGEADRAVPYAGRSFRKVNGVRFYQLRIGNDNYRRFCISGIEVLYRAATKFGYGER